MNILFIMYDGVVNPTMRVWYGSEVPEEITSAYRGPVARNHLSSCGRKPAIHHGHTGSLK